MRRSKGQSDMRSLVRRVFAESAREPMLTLTLLRQWWREVVGPELAAQTWPQRLDRGTLWIAAPDACWSYELQFFKAELLNSVQAFLDSDAIRDVRFRVGTVPSAGGDLPTGPPASDSTDATAQDAALSTAPPNPVPAFEPDAGSAPAIEDPAAPDENPDAPAALTRAAATIGDPALRAVFQRSLARQRQAREQRGVPRPAAAPADANAKEP